MPLIGALLYCIAFYEEEFTLSDSGGKTPIARLFEAVTAYRSRNLQQSVLFRSAYYANGRVKWSGVKKKERQTSQMRFQEADVSVHIIREKLNKEIVLHPFEFYMLIVDNRDIFCTIVNNLNRTIYLQVGLLSFFLYVLLSGYSFCNA